MGGFLGIGESAQEKALKEQKRLAKEEAERARRDAEIRQAEKVAKKGQETANIQLGVEEEEVKVEDKVKKKAPTIGPAKSLGLGGIGKKGSGVQL